MRPAERAEILRKVGDLITERARRSPDRDARHRPGDRADAARRRCRARPTTSASSPRWRRTSPMARRLPSTADFLNYTIAPPDRRCRADHALEHAVHAGRPGRSRPAWPPAIHCVLKPAEWSPLSSAEAGRGASRDAGLPAGVFNIVHGAGETPARRWSQHPGVQRSPSPARPTTGKAIMRDGAATLKRFSMELGGKSPVVVFADADLDRALDAAVFGVFSLNGERCTAGSRLPACRRRSTTDFVAKLPARVARIRVGDPLDKTTEVGPLIHPEPPGERARLPRDRPAGRRAIWSPAAGAIRGWPTATTAAHRASPTWTTGCGSPRRRSSGRCCRDARSTTRSEAHPHRQRRARTGSPPTSGPRTSRRAHRVAPAIECGMVWVNSQNVRDLRTPFGGAK